MKHIFLLISLALLCFNGSIAQSETKSSPFNSDGTWFYADSSLDFRAISTRSALLHLSFNIDDPSLPDLVHNISIWKKDYPWLGVVGELTAESPSETSPEYITKLSRQIGWDYPLFVPAQQSYESVDHWSYSLYSMDSHLIASSNVASSIAQIDDHLNALQTNIRKFDLKMEPSYTHWPFRGLEKLTVLLNPSDIAVDPAFEWIFISDTGHDRIIITNMDGEVEFVVGTGTKGAADGEMSEASFDHPTGLAYDAEHKQLYIADRGNNSIRRLDVDKRMVSTINLANEKGKAYALPYGPDRLTLVKGTLIVSCPSANNFYKVNLADRITSIVFGSEERGSELDKNPLKTQLYSSSNHVFENESDFYFDNVRGMIYKSDKLKNSVLLAEDSLLADDEKAMFDRSLHHLNAPTFHQGRLLCWNSESDGLVEIDPYSYSIRSLELEGPSLPGLITGMVSARGTLYMIDGDSGRIFLMKGKKVETLALKKKDRVLHIQSSADLVLHTESVALMAAGQTRVILRPIIPPHFSMDPHTESHVHINGNDPGAVITEGNLRQQEINLVLFPDLISNQINLMAELNFCDKADPSKCYQRWVMINVLLDNNANAVPEVNLDLELFKGL